MQWKNLENFINEDQKKVNMFIKTACEVSTTCVNTSIVNKYVNFWKVITYKIISNRCVFINCFQE